MQELHAECLRAGSALMSDDFASLQEAANAISGHPMPDEVVAAIKSKLGRDLRAFEALDDASHKAARNLSARAAVKDSVGASKAYNNLTATCVGCHKQFRATLKPLSD
jgi:cytochrome c556